jgi:hypothetical protein
VRLGGVVGEKIEGRVDPGWRGSSSQRTHATTQQVFQDPEEIAMTTITVDSTALHSLSLEAAPRAASSSRAAVWTGRVLSGLGVLFMAFDGIAKVLDLIPPDVKAANSLGWPDHVMFAVGALSLVCTALYLVPRTALVGAILLTGYFGGAIASHVRVESPLFSHTLFPVYIAALFWVGLYLRDSRVRALFAPKS